MFCNCNKSTKLFSTPFFNIANVRGEFNAKKMQPQGINLKGHITDVCLVCNVMLSDLNACQAK